MKNNLILAVIILLISLSAQAQDRKSNSNDSAEQQILALDRIWADASVRGDMAAFDRLFDENIVVTGGNGAVRNKAQEISDSIPKSPNIKVSSFVTEEVKVRIYGDTAVLNGIAKWRLNMAGREVDNVRRYMSVYAKQKGVWRIVALHITHPGQSMQRSSP